MAYNNCGLHLGRNVFGKIYIIIIIIIIIIGGAVLSP
jgi:hypothetical protein